MPKEMTVGFRPYLTCTGGAKSKTTKGNSWFIDYNNVDEHIGSANVGKTVSLNCTAQGKSGTKTETLATGSKDITIPEAVKETDVTITAKSARRLSITK